MDTLTITIEVSHETASLLEEKAQKKGKDAAGYIEVLIEKDIKKEIILDEIFSPVRKNFDQSGMSEEELDLLVEGERQAIWEEANFR